MVEVITVSCNWHFKTRLEGQRIKLAWSDMLTHFPNLGGTSHVTSSRSSATLFGCTLSTCFSNVGSIHRFRDGSTARIQILLDNRGTPFEELEANFSSAGFKQQIQLSNSVSGYAIPYPLAQVLAVSLFKSCFVSIGS